MDKLSKIISYIVGGFGALIFLFSVLYASVLPESDLYKSLGNCKETSMILLFGSYCVILIAIAVYSNSLPITGSKFKDVSMLSFYTWSLFIPFAIFSLVLTIVNSIGWQFNIIVQIICWSIQAFFIAIWFFPKLKELKNKAASKERDVDLMKLDYYSTLAILVLTIVWVVYDILNIKVGFAIVMGEFLCVQMFIKKEQIKEKENS